MRKQDFEVAFQEVLADKTNDYDCLSENARVVARWMIESEIGHEDDVVIIEGEEAQFTLDEYYDYFNSCQN